MVEEGRMMLLPSPLMQAQTQLEGVAEVEGDMLPLQGMMRVERGG